jgi:hypothetical protein
MIAAAIDGATKRFRAEPGCMGLTVRKQKVLAGPNKVPMTALITSWTPTPTELWALAHGANVHVTILTDGEHPPIMLDVGKLPDGGPLGPITFVEPESPKEGA